jgi:hypothetical protein
VEDRSVAEVAEVMGVAEGTVKRQSADAVAKLRRILGDDFIDDARDDGERVAHFDHSRVDSPSGGSR